MRWLARPWVLWPVSVIGAVILLGLLATRAFYNAYRVPAGSMLPTLEAGDYILASPFDPADQDHGDPLRRGQVLIFRYPDDRRVEYIKRCVAVAGDTVEVRDGLLRVNGEVYESALDDPEADNSCVPSALTPDLCPRPHTLHDPRAREKHPLNTAFGPLAVPRGTVFVMGDNRYNSLDSRHFGPVPVADVTARVVAIYFTSDVMRIGDRIR